ncbi:MAG: hypothetical protein Q7R46_01645 [bacterium]|nr:hypothetical protein [bacterium]
MDKIKKALKKFSAKEKEAVKNILNKLEKGNLLGFDIQKLSGHEDIFRVKKGSIRIIYRKTEAKKIFILAIERRSEKTYVNF